MIDSLIRTNIHDAGPVDRAMYIGLAMTALLLALLVTSPAYSSESAGSAASTAWQSGVVTAVHGQTVEIDGREFGFSPKVVVLDHKGQKVDLSYITRKSEVKFRVMTDEVHKIEHIIVHQPE